MQKILVSGSLAYDHIMNFKGLFRDHFMPDKLHNINLSFNIDARQENFGGTGGNIAYNLALLGEKAAIIATAGKDFERYKKHLDERGIDTGSIHIDEKEETAFAYILTDSGDNQIAAYHPGAGAKAYGGEIQMGKDTIAIIAPGCIEDMRVFPGMFRAGNVKYIYDPGQSIPGLTTEELKDGITGAEVVFANDYEFALIDIKTGWKEADIVKVAKTLVVTLGEVGSRVITQEGETLVTAVKAIDNRDPTGAGDAYRAGYILGMSRGLPAATCSKIAAATAVFCVESKGTQSHAFSLDDVKKRYEQAYGEVLSI